MSAPNPNTGNSMNDYFSALSDVAMLTPHLLEAASEDNFVI